MKAYIYEDDFKELKEKGFTSTTLKTYEKEFTEPVYILTPEQLDAERRKAFEAAQSIAVLPNGWDKMTYETYEDYKQTLEEKPKC